MSGDGDYGCSDSEDDEPSHAAQQPKHASGRLQQGIDAIWSPNTQWLGPEEQLLRAAAEHLAAVEPWTAPGVQPHHNTVALSKLGHLLRQHPCAHAVPKKLSRLFDDSPYFEQLTFGNQGSTALLRLNVAAIMDASSAASVQSASYCDASGPGDDVNGCSSCTQDLLRAVDVLWPTNAWLVPEEHLRRSAALYLLDSCWDDEGLLDTPLVHTAPLSLVGEHLALHPARRIYAGKLSALFGSSQYFRRSRWGKTDLLTLDKRVLCTALQNAVRVPAQVVWVFPLPPTPVLEQPIGFALPRLVLGINWIDVRLQHLTTVSQADLDWLLSAVCLGRAGQANLCLGFDTEFKVDKLALIQLGNAERVLLIRVPFTSQAAQVPACLKELLASPLILKAAAEAWQDVLMVYHNLGIGTAGGVCLTTALASLFPNSKPSLFTMMRNVFPGCGLAKITPTSDWFAGTLDQAQLRYAALDAFVSWAVAAGRRALVDKSPKMSVSSVSELELRLMCDAMSVSNHQRSRDLGLVQHDFSTAEHRKGALHVQMERFKTRIRHGASTIEVHARDGAVAHAKVSDVKGKRLKLAPCGSFAGFASHRQHGVEQIRFTDNSEGNEEKQQKELFTQIMCSKVSMAQCPILNMLIGGTTSRSLGLQGAERTDAEEQVLSRCRAAGLNPSQTQAVVATLLPETRLHIVHGPPGTGKTRVISEAAAIWCSTPSLEPPVAQQHGVPLMLCCTRSNVAALNIARALIRNPGVKDRFKLVVSQEFHLDWHEHMYAELQGHVITSDKLMEGIGYILDGQMKVLVCTLSMLCSTRLQDKLLRNRCALRLLVDEASQVYVGDYLVHLHRHGSSLRSITCFGDDKQLPPFGSELTRVCSVFDSHLVWDSGAGCIPSVLLDVSYRLPAQLCSFVSEHVYDGLLKSKHATSSSRMQSHDLVWHDVRGSEGFNGKSVFNKQEAEAVREWAELLQSQGHQHWKVLSMYDAQRHEIEQQLRSQSGLPWEDRVFNVDTFQGREEDIIIVSLAATSRLGFLRNDRRVNVMLTRCKRRLIVIGSLALAWRHEDTLIGKLADLCNSEGLVTGQPG